MKNQFKITFAWLLIGIGVAIHVIIEVAEAVSFKPLPKEPLNEGIPLAGHIIFVLAMIIPLLFSFLTLFYSKKAFKIVSLVYASLLALLNTVHFIEAIIGHLNNYTQIVLLLFVACINVVLVVLVNKWRKE